jgi:hypothetical protein
MLLGMGLSRDVLLQGGRRMVITLKCTYIEAKLQQLNMNSLRNSFLSQRFLVKHYSNVCKAKCGQVMVISQIGSHNTLRKHDYMGQ